MTYIALLIYLFAAHFLADYPLQGDFLAKAKNHLNPITGIPWFIAMVAHVFIHAFFVFVLTGSYLFFVIEFISHFTLDHFKCSNKISFLTDQFAHLFIKVLYVMILVWLHVLPIIHITII